MFYEVFDWYVCYIEKIENKFEKDIFKLVQWKWIEYVEVFK